MKILFCDAAFEDARKNLERYLPEDTILYCPKEQIYSLIDQVDVAIPLMSRLDRDLIYKGGRLRLIQQFGVGLEGVDLAAARERGISVANVPSDKTGNAASVAEWVIFLMLALARDFPSQLKNIAERKLGVPTGKTLFGKKVGIVGMGNLGKAITFRLKALGMQILALKRHPGECEKLYELVDFLGGPDDLDKLLQEVDFLILAVPLTAETKNLIGKCEFSLMKPNAYLINVSRGPVVDYLALLEALENRQIAGVGLDVFWSEPIDPNDPLFRYNVIVSPHIAGVTDLSLDSIAKEVAENIDRLRLGKPLNYVVS
ncbi:Phosphoglycerate dehydrogenase [Desulfacinum infernum DSM 9756]|jgi:phosphoglycerate dehydrogenase-like enzyme|uniref:Phosphoglycerate dehydrogenase n=1 Tax=Desulfacinum infernum DSM 9756 TaxID=1121391 RepID=A0A1M4T8P8_9BACT|nr:2-hydroxyacid dehydrogenase [Desulfacinum infernum]MBC7360532.1 NAD(P)-binding domain-containing protein [Desulfacinum sp.]SHE40805.1 Phosphoglycerate dehydrogenase [Desulfacinum infernum DSM 9756]